MQSSSVRSATSVGSRSSDSSRRGTMEFFPLRMMGTVIGGTAMASNLGMATGPLAGGLIYDSFGSYMWLYVGAWGIGAFLIGLTFRPMVKEQAEVARAV